MLGGLFSSVTALIVLGVVRKELPSAKIILFTIGTFAFLLFVGIGLSFTQAGQKITDPLFGKENIRTQEERLFGTPRFL